MYSDFLNNIAGIEAGIKDEGGLGENKVLVFIANSPTNAVMFQINYKNNACARDTLKTYTSYDCTTPSGIAGILNDVKSQAPALKYDMLIGCHGSGWIPKTIQDYYQTRSFGGTSEEYQTDIVDLASGIQAANMHIELLSFDDCYMANLEVAYDLRNVADYLMASTSEIMSDGLPYRYMWSYIASSTINPQGLCEAFYNYYANSSYPYGTLSVIDLSYMDSIADMMASANANYQFDTSLTDDLQKLDGFKTTIYFDFGDYIDKLVTDESTRLSIRTMLTNLVSYQVHTDQIYTAYSSYNGGISTIDINTFSGITISDPTQNSSVATALTNTAWWEATH